MTDNKMDSKDVSAIIRGLLKNEFDRVQPIIESTGWKLMTVSLSERTSKCLSYFEIFAGDGNGCQLGTGQTVDEAVEDLMNQIKRPQGQKEG